jgi:predicted dehydrogenase
MVMGAARFAIVGGGFRSNYFLRIARALPTLFACSGMVVRDAARAQAVREAWGVPAHPDLDALVAAGRPDFVILSVTKEAVPSLLAELARLRLPVLCETPPAPTLEGLLDLWRLVQGGARIQVAEQHGLQPLNAARIAVARSGLLGAVSHVQLGSTHDYHATGLMRQMLGFGFEAARITARDFTAPVMRGPGRAGPPTEPAIDPEQQVLAWLDYPGKLGVYDFAAGQPRSWIRADRTLIRGERGELSGDELRYMKDYKTSVRLDLQRIDTGRGNSPESYYHRGYMAGDQWLYENPYPNAPLGDDEIAGATMMQRMAEYAAGGPDAYAFAEGAQDQYLALCITEAVARGEPVTAEVQPWAG